MTDGEKVLHCLDTNPELSSYLYLRTFDLDTCTVVFEVNMLVVFAASVVIGYVAAAMGWIK